MVFLKGYFEKGDLEKSADSNIHYKLPSVQRLKSTNCKIKPRLTHKAPSIVCGRRHFQMLLLFQYKQIGHDISGESSAGRRFS